MLASIGPYVATAAATLTVAWIVQFWITPRVESRKRREARWEADILALGEFVEFDLADARSTFMSALYGAAALADIEETTSNADRLRRAREENRTEIREAGASLRRAHSRLEWMMRKALALERHSIDASRLRFRATFVGYKATSALWDALDSDKPALDSDQCLQLSRDLDDEMKPIKTYAMDGLERRAPVPQTRLQSRARSRGRLILNGAKRKFAGRFERKPAAAPSEADAS